MVVSMIQVILELPDVTSIKEKRRIVKSLRERLISRYRITAAEVDLHESLAFSQIGGAVVSNSRRYGESVMNKVLRFIEDNAPGRVQDAKIISEMY
ncbi:MAG: DUF503 domain-containing protein [Spirochaetaceae bacterium]